MLLQKHYKTNTAAGFTIVELLIVIVVLGILAAITIGAILGTQARARDQVRNHNIHAVQNALEVYYLYNGHYPIHQEMALEAGYTFMQANFQGFNLKALIAPDSGDPHTSFHSSTAVSPTVYRYYVFKADGSSCAYTASPPAVGDPTPADCVRYNIAYYSEAKSQIIYVQGLHGW